MSGGSFNYLFDQDPYEQWELARMADELRSRGMYEAEEATRALIPARAPKELSELWKAIEWHVSCDSSEASVAKAYIRYLETWKETT